MQEITTEDLATLPTHKSLKALARALRHANVPHQIVGNFDSVEIGEDLEEILELEEFKEYFTRYLKEAYADHLLEDMTRRGLVSPSSVTEEGLVAYKATELGRAALANA